MVHLCVAIPEFEERLGRFAGSGRQWEHPLADQLVLAGSRVTRRRAGPLQRSYLVWFVSGGKHLREGAGDRSFGAGDVLVLPSGVSFVSEERPDVGGRFLAVRFELDAPMLHQLVRSEPSVSAATRLRSDVSRRTHQAPNDPDLCDALDRCVEYALRGSRSTSIARRRLEDVLITLAEAEPHAFSTLVTPPESVDRLRELLRATPHVPWSLGEAARRLGTSPATMKRRLAERGASFSSLLRQVRLEEGRRLLVDAGQSVLQASLNVGYASPSKFAAAYERRFGRSPAKDKSRRR